MPKKYNFWISKRTYGHATRDGPITQKIALCWSFEISTHCVGGNLILNRKFPISQESRNRFRSTRQYPKSFAYWFWPFKIFEIFPVLLSNCSSCNIWVFFNLRLRKSHHDQIVDSESHGGHFHNSKILHFLRQKFEICQYWNYFLANLILPCRQFSPRTSAENNGGQQILGQGQKRMGWQPVTGKEFHHEHILNPLPTCRFNFFTFFKFSKYFLDKVWTDSSGLIRCFERKLRLKMV